MNFIGNLFSAVNKAYENYQGPENVAKATITKAEALVVAINKVAGTRIEKNNVDTISREVLTLKNKLIETQTKLQSLKDQVLSPETVTDILKEVGTGAQLEGMLNHT